MESVGSVTIYSMYTATSVDFKNNIENLRKSVELSYLVC
jgi:hypothetical protein